MQKIKITLAIVIFHIISSSVYAGVIIDVACSNPSQILGLSHKLTTLKKSNVGQIIVSVRGQCVHMFSTKHNKYAEEVSKLELLSELGVTFLADEYSLEASNVKKVNLAEFVYVQNDLLTELAKLQERDNYSYIHYAASAYMFSDESISSKKHTKEKKFKFNW